MGDTVVRDQRREEVDPLQVIGLILAFLKAKLVANQCSSIRETASGELDGFANHSAFGFAESGIGAGSRNYSLAVSRKKSCPALELIAMVAAYHLIWTAYGWWLPNDPRGSMSSEVRCVDLESLGEIHHGRKRIQPAGKVISEFYDAARGILKHPLLKLDEDEVVVLADSFGGTIRERSYTCYACAIMPDHVHLLIRKHRDESETIIGRFQDASREAILERAQPGRTLDHPVWGGPGWKVYLNSRQDIERVIRYIEQNPIKIRRPPQNWLFVTPYDGWLPGQVTRSPSAKPQAENRRRR